MFSGCSLVCVSVYVSWTLLTQYFEKFWMYFHQTLPFWDKDKRFKLWDQKVKVEGHLGFNVLESALFGLVNVTSWELLNWISPDFLQWGILGQGWKLQFLGVKSQGHSITRGPANRRIQSLVLCWVLISSYFEYLRNFCML